MQSAATHLQNGFYYQTGGKAAVSKEKLQGM